MEQVGDLVEDFKQTRALRKRRRVTCTIVRSPLDHLRRAKCSTRQAADFLRPGVLESLSVRFLDLFCPVGTSRLSSSAMPFSFLSACFSSSSVSARRLAALLSPSLSA